MAVVPKSPRQQVSSVPRIRFTQIRKRDGRLVPFDPSRITEAILKAGRATGEFMEDTAGILTDRVLELAAGAMADGTPGVEWMQDLVEQVLLASPYHKTAKAYILYRDQRARIREMVKKADLELIDSYLDQLDWRVNENSNMAYSLQGLNNYISSEVSKTYWLNKIYQASVRDAHSSGAIHIHVLGLLSVYCVGWDLQDLLRSGFRGAEGKAESARHAISALRSGRSSTSSIRSRAKPPAHRHSATSIRCWPRISAMTDSHTTR